MLFLLLYAHITIKYIRKYVLISYVLRAKREEEVAQQNVDII
jgi:hypothetical protein